MNNSILLVVWIQFLLDLFESYLMTDQEDFFKIHLAVAYTILPCICTVESIQLWPVSVVTDVSQITI